MNLPDAFVCGAVFGLITGSYGYTYKRTKDVETCIKIIKEELKEINEKLNQLLGKIEVWENLKNDT